MKTVIIGLDGATFEIIEPLCREGRMPVMSRLIKEGSSSPLRSTLLPNSFPGWASCTTGTSEGMHGVFAPFIKNPGSYRVRAMSGRDIMTRPVWEILTSHEGRSLVVNVPTTYPPEPIHGEMITGMLTPGVDSEFTFPSSLREALLAAVPGYIVEPGRHPDKNRRAADFRRATDMHERAAHFLIDRGDWDFLMVVFSVLDRAQHDFWADMDSSHPRHDPATPARFRNFIHETYEQLDLAVGRLIDRLPADVRVFIVSDHGFCAELYEVRINEVLAEAGLLAFRHPRTRKNRARISSVKQRVRNRLGLTEKNETVLERKLRHSFDYLSELDFRRTRAFFAQDKGVWVNLAGREPEGSVAEQEFENVIEEARAALQKVTDGDGTPVFQQVLRRREAFSGAWSSRMPDLVMVPRSWEYVYNERPSYGEVIVPADSTTGTHSQDGVLIAWGRGIETGCRFSPLPSLKDIGPTALLSLGCPIAEDMDGRPLIEVFSDSIELCRRGSAYRQPRPAAPGAVYTEGEEAEIRSRLRALGYIE